MDAMEWLEAQGADINALDSYDQTPMHRAAMWNTVDAMEWLKAQGADINAQNSYNITPMHRAAQNGALAAMKWLKAQGAEFNARDSIGNPPMHIAASKILWLRWNGSGRRAPISTRGPTVVQLQCTSLR